MYNEKHKDQANVADMEIPAELCLELLMAADYLDTWSLVFDPGVWVLPLPFPWKVHFWPLLSLVQYWHSDMIYGATRRTMSLKMILYGVWPTQKDWALAFPHWNVLNQENLTNLDTFALVNPFFWKSWYRTDCQTVVWAIQASYILPDEHRGWMSLKWMAD